MSRYARTGETFRCDCLERSGDPARGLPRIDRKVHRTGGYLEAACHSLMHVVGRNWARRHRITLENIFRHVPRSNDPGCSAGFGMGMVIYLGTKLVLNPRSVVPTCTRLPPCDSQLSAW